MCKVLNFFVATFLFSCANVGDHPAKEKDDPLAVKFQLIKGKLQEFSDKHNAKLSTVWSIVEKHDPNVFDSFLVRHIVWTDGRFGKAILIQQHSDNNGIDTTSWDFKNIAWLQDTLLTAKPTYENDLLTKVDFQIIERDIDQLLHASENSLSKVKVEDLK